MRQISNLQYVSFLQDGVAGSLSSDQEPKMQTQSGVHLERPLTYLGGGSLRTTHRPGAACAQRIAGESRAAGGKRGNEELKAAGRDCAGWPDGPAKGSPVRIRTVCCRGTHHA